MDLTKAEDTALWLENELGIEVIDRSYRGASQRPLEDYDAFTEGLREGRLKHTGDLGLRRHVMNAIARRMPGDKYRFDRPSRSRNERQQELRVIDALTAASMVHTVASAVQELEVPWIELISG